MRHSKSGIYRIFCTKNNKSYIGSTEHISKRFSDHRWNLRKGTHKNSILQEDFNKFGIDAFLFEEVEYINGDKLDRLLRERYYIEQFPKERIYNIERIGKDGSKIMDDTSKQKLSVIRVGIPRPKYVLQKIAATISRRRFFRKRKK